MSKTPDKKASKRNPPSKPIPVRFNASVMAELDAVAREDGLARSAWIRSLVIKELRRRRTVRED